MSRAKNLPRLANYEAALKRYENTKPRHDGVRPLGARRDHKVFKIYYTPRNEVCGGRVDCMMWDTYILSYHEDGRLIIRTGGWDTVTTRAALNALLPAGVNVYGRKNETVLHLNGGVYRLEDVPWLVADPTAPSGYVVPHPNRETVHVINRKRANAVLRRPEYRDFLLYAKGILSALVETGGMLDVGDVHYANRHVVPARTAYTWAIPHMLKGENITEWERSEVPEYHERMFACVVLALRTVLHTAHGRGGAWATPAQVMAVVRQGILRWHASEVLDKVTLDAGEIADDKYETWTHPLRVGML
jgi:hypothetical protein